jgi:pimeloyl-ACP methyl ester carboxylesterase
MTMASLAVTLATLQPAHNFSETARVRLSSGVSVEYLDRPAAIVEGDVDATTASYRPPLLLLHGWPDSVRTFDLLIPHLNPRLRVIRVGLRGFGGSDGAKGMPPIPSDAGGFTIEQMAADVRAFIDALGLRMVYLGGVSMGSFVAHAVAAHWPRVVSKLVLVASCDVAADSVKFYAAARALAMERPEWVKGSTELTPAFVSSFQVWGGAAFAGARITLLAHLLRTSPRVPFRQLAPLLGAC